MSGKVFENCRKAAKAARRLRRVFPEVDFYVPGEHEIAVQLLVQSGRLNTSDILWADLQILEACHGWMCYLFEESRGCEMERDRAEELTLTYGSEDICTYDIEKITYPILRKDFSGLIERTLQRYKEKRDEQLRQ